MGWRKIRDGMQGEWAVSIDIDRAFEWLRYAAAACAALWLQIPSLTQLLILLMGVDIVLGVILAVRRRDLSVATAMDGMTRKIVSLILVGVAALLTPYVSGLVEINLAQAASAFYIVPEMLSFSRNSALLGVPVFSEFERVLDYFRTYSAGERER
jgi:toxin secretion/phage lysis holin